MYFKDVIKRLAQNTRTDITVYDLDGDLNSKKDYIATRTGTVTATNKIGSTQRQVIEYRVESAKAGKATAYEYTDKVVFFNYSEDGKVGKLELYMKP